MSDSELVNLILNLFPKSYMSFYSSIMLNMRGNADPLSFMELQGLMFCKEQMRRNMASRNNHTVAMFS